MKKATVNILYGVLDWGLGHATRSIPVIRYLRDCNHRVILVGNGQSLQLLKHHFPELETIDFKCPEIRYGKSKSYILKLVVMAPYYMALFRRQYYRTRKIVEDKNIDLVISDNRPGLRSHLCKSIYITHQITPDFGRWSGMLSKIASQLHQAIIKKYNSCLVPDNAYEPSLSGKLSHCHELQNVQYIGILSRFATYKAEVDKKEQILLLLSGPEPQRTIFEDILLSMFSQCEHEVILVRGTYKHTEKAYPPKFTVIDIAEDELLYKLIVESSLIFCRSGYSTLMDLALCRKKAIIVPTPGQSEQEYLARMLEEKYGFTTISQNSLPNFEWKLAERSIEWNFPTQLLFKEKICSIIDQIIEKK
ncbi:MAG TPA: glycosyltransferase family protein [Bacteroidales bacterium]|nr:glycosyltransferase family protein [Bacteroidales bacterium]